MIRFRASAGVLGVLGLLAEESFATEASSTTHSAATAVVHFDIQSGEAGRRLHEFGDQANLRIKILSQEIDHLQLPALRGDFEPMKALQQMIAGTRIHHRLGEGGFIVLEIVESGTTAAPAKNAEQPEALHDRRSAGTLEEVLVSARADWNTLSLYDPNQTILRDRIDSAGFRTPRDLLRTLPQVFGGGPTEDTFVVGSEARTNSTRGIGINIRGLGASSTLVMMNGMRLATSGTEGVYSDVSNVPMNAVERVDFATSNVATFFGADSPGGVVNFVMREKFDGVETEAGFGSSTRGGDLTERFVSQLMGGRTERGHGFFSFELSNRGKLRAAERSLARSNLTEYGGSNFDNIQSNPGNISLAGSIWSIPRGQDGTALEPGDFMRDAPNLQDQFKGSDILLNQKRLNVFATWHQKLTDGLSLFSDVLVGQRDADGNGTGAMGSFTVPVTNAYYVSPVALSTRVPLQMRYNFYDDLGPQVSDARVRTTNVTFGLEQRFEEWEAKASFGYASERTRSRISNQVDGEALNVALARADRATAFNPFGDGSHTNPATLQEIRGSSKSTYRSSITSANLLLHGPVYTLPTGEVRLAVGGDMREHRLLTALQSDVTLTPTDTRSDHVREVHSAFAELQLPVVGADKRLPGIEELTVTFAERYEKYSDFGSSLATRYGLTWTARPRIKFRSTYSESFRPPGLLDLDEGSNVHAFTQLLDPVTAKPVPVMIWAGKNRDATQENARSWTAGVELQPESNPGSGVAVTYFRTRFVNRLATPVFSADLLSNPTLAPLVTLNPTADDRAEVCSRAPQSGGSFGDCLDTPIAALVDLRLRNDAQAFTEGFDLLAKYSVDTRIGSFSFDFNGNYLLKFEDAKTKSSPLVNRMNTPHNPPNFRARTSFRWERAGFGLGTGVSYQNHYMDTDSLPQRGVSSWTTVDISADYELARAGAFAGTTLVLGVENAFDRDPPFLNNAAASIGYDQENGDLTGRVVTLQVKKKW